MRRHLDNAATTHPKPPEVRDAVARAIAEFPGNPGRGASRAAREATSLVEGARRGIAAALGLDEPSRLAFTLGATDALSLALATLVRPGTRVVTTTFEHAAVARPLRRAEREGRAEIVRVPPEADGRIDPDRVARIARDADCVVLTAASNVTGIVQPVAEVAAALAGRGTPVLVDAAQAAGTLSLPLGALGPRVAVAIAGHKSLLGPMGVGAILVGEDLALGPWREGGTGDDGAETARRGAAGRLEAGTLPVPAIAGLGAGVAWWQSQGPGALRSHETLLFERMTAGLRATAGVRLPSVERFGTSAPRVPLACFMVAGYGCDETEAVLDAEFGITVRAGLHCAPEAHECMGTHPAGTVRASIGPTTTEADVDALVDAVATLARERPG